MLRLLGGLVASVLLSATGANAFVWMPERDYYYQPPIMAPQPSWPYDAPIYRAPRPRPFYRQTPDVARSYDRPRNILVRVSNAEQRMHVYVDGALAHSWPVSTARKGYRTPVGSYSVKRMERMWYSRKYDWSPMPHSLFFAGGYAIHGSYSVRQLGRPASHGCIRLAPGNAATLYALVRSSGPRNTRIVVTG